MAASAALLVGPLFFENDKWKSLSPGIILKVREKYISFPTRISHFEILNRELGV
jgi:hypothetical protein